jgi:RimJ/RimL family protein N-acetyltransferase
MEERASGVFAGFVGLNYQDDWTEGEHKTEVGWRLDRARWGRDSPPRARWRACVTGSKVWI